MPHRATEALGATRGFLGEATHSPNTPEAALIPFFRPVYRSLLTKPKHFSISPNEQPDWFPSKQR